MTERRVSIVFTDVEGSTDLSAVAGEDVAQAVLRTHEEVVRATVDKYGGREVKSLGDGFMLSFGSARDAVGCALEIQRELVERNRGSRRPLSVRIGVNTGEVTERDGDLFGATVNAAARIVGHAQGGQVLVGPEVLEEAGEVADATVVDRGLFWLRGFPERWRLYDVRGAGLDGVLPRAQAGRTELVGREEERAELRRRLEEAGEGRGSFVMIGGEPGVGKTRLAQEVVAEATARGMLAFIGHCSEAEGDPYEPVVEIVESALRVVPPPVFRETVGDAAGEIARLVPDVRRRFDDVPPPLELPPEQSRRLLFNSVRDFVERTARRRPLVLVLDDLHWADESTLLLVQHLAQHIRETPLLAIGTYRDVELDVARPLARTLEELLRRRQAHRMSLSRLGTDGVHGMLAALGGGDPPTRLVDAIYAETEGNPFFVEEVFQHLSEEGRILDGAGRWLPDLEIAEVDVPESVRLVIGRRLERLEEESRKVLTAAAVLGRSFPLDLLEATIDADADAVLDGLDEAERSRLVTSSVEAGASRFAFAHELIRQTLLAQLSLIRRQRFHLRAAEALEELHTEGLEEHAPEIANHLMEAGPSADAAKMARFCRLAGERALETAAFGEAVRHLDNALSLEPKDPTERADLLWSLGMAKRSLGHWDEAQVLWEEALTAYERLGEVDRLGKLCSELALQMAWEARWEECLQVVGRGLSALADRETEDRVRLLGLGGLIISAAGNHDAAEGMLEQASDMATRIGDRQLVSYLPVARAIHEYNYARFHKVIENGEPGMEALRDDGAIWDLVSVGPWVAFSHVIYGRLDRATTIVDEVAPLADRLGHLGSQLLIHRIRTFGRLAVSPDLDAWERSAREDLERCRRAKLPWDSHSFVWLGIASLWRGRLDQAIEHLREAVSLEPPGAYSGIATGFLVLGLAHAGRGEEAMAVFDDFRSRNVSPDGPATLGAAMLYGTGAEAAAVIGDADRANQLLALLDEALEPNLPLRGWDFAMVDRIRGMCLAVTGRLDEAEVRFQRALRLAADIPVTLEQPQTRLWYGRMLLQRGAQADVDRAREVLTEAKAGFDRFGMPGFARAADEALRGGAAVSSGGSSAG